MAEGIRSRLTAAEGRRFGLTVGGAFLLFASIAWWRTSEVAALVLSAPAAGLLLAALVIPSRLGPVERAWMRLAHLISKVTTPVVMGVMYLGVLLPVGVLRRRLGGNPLAHAEVEQGFWRPRAAGARRSNSMQRQF